MRYKREKMLNVRKPSECRDQGEVNLYENGGQ